MNLRIKHNFDEFSAIARFVLAGVLIPLSFCDYFGQTGWIFAACFGSERGGTLALIMFILGALLAGEFRHKSKKALLPLLAVMLFNILTGKLFISSAKPQFACLCAAADGLLFCSGIKLLIADKKQVSAILYGVFAGIAAGLL